MNINAIIRGNAISADELVNRKKLRAVEGQKLLASGGKSLICFTLNIPGSIKLFPLARAGFAEGLNEILALFPNTSVLKVYKQELDTGCEAMILLDEDPVKVKEKTILLEDSHPIGRLFDIDVPGLTRQKLGRKPRQCLICGNDALYCLKNHSHSLDFILGETVRLFYSYFKNKAADICAACATRALLYEVSATPKPGLVDRANSGSHKDMDFFTFIDSSAALTPWFRDFFCIGWDCKDKSDRELFDQLRYSGRKAEAAMFHATSGINTHKGLIFSMAVLCGALGKECSMKEDYLLQSPLQLEKLLNRCVRLGKCSLDDFSALKAAELPIAKTAGERFYTAHQIEGARGEASKGFPTALKYGLSPLRDWISSGASLNDAACAALLSIIAATEDTNMISRSTLEEAAVYRKEAAKILSFVTLKDLQEQLYKLDQLYIQNNLSPGGSADLLAVALMLYFLEEKSIISFC